MTKPLIPHSRPTVGQEEIEAVSRVIASGQIAQGREVETFEREFADRIGVKYAAAVSSGTAALHLALLALGVSAGDEVIIPGFVCAALLNAVHYTGAKPIIADIAADTFNLDPEDAARRITSKTRAIIVPHMFGLMADMAAFRKLGVPLIEDCAQSVGARSGENMAGSIGSAGVFSFYATKMMTCGEGGMVVSDSKEFIEQIRQNREYDNREKYAPRFNYKMTDIQAAMGRQQLKKLSDFIARRREIAGMYNQAFSGLGITAVTGGDAHVYYRYVLQVDQKVDEWIEQVRREGVTCARPVYKPLHRYFDNESCPFADLAFKHSLSIPIYPTLSDSDAKRILDTVAKLSTGFDT